MSHEDSGGDETALERVLEEIVALPVPTVDAAARRFVISILERERGRREDEEKNEYTRDWGADWEAEANTASEGDFREASSSLSSSAASPSSLSFLVAIAQPETPPASPSMTSVGGVQTRSRASRSRAHESRSSPEPAVATPSILPPSWIDDLDFSNFSESSRDTFPQNGDHDFDDFNDYELDEDEELLQQEEAELAFAINESMDDEAVFVPATAGALARIESTVAIDGINVHRRNDEEHEKSEKSEKSGARGEQGGNRDNCYVCLSEMEPGERLARLPDCAHLFHFPCISQWLRVSGTCPLCRNRLEDHASSAATSISSPSPNSSLSSIQQLNSALANEGEEPPTNTSARRRTRRDTRLAAAAETQRRVRRRLE